MNPGDDQRPDREAEAPEDRWAAIDPIVRLTATVSVSLEHGANAGALDLDRADRRALHRLGAVPSGAHVRICVGSRRLLTISAVQWLHEAAQRLDVEIDAADPAVVYLWHRAILAGNLQ